MWTLIILFWCQSPKELARGLVEGTQSLFSNTVFAFSNAVTRISKAAHKVCHTLYFVLKFIYNSNNHRCGSSDLVSWSWCALVLFLFLETLSTCMLPSFPGWGTSFPSVGPHTWVYTLFLEWLWLCFTPTFNHNYDFILCTLNYSGLWRVDLITMIAPLIDAICGVETNNLCLLVESCLRVIASYKFSPMPWPWILSWCPIVTSNKIEPKTVNYNHSNYSQLHLKK